MWAFAKNLLSILVGRLRAINFLGISGWSPIKNAAFLNTPRIAAVTFAAVTFLALPFSQDIKVFTK